MAQPSASSGGSSDPASGRFPREVMHAAATMYYIQDATQAEIANRLGMSRPSVSRLLSEARRSGVVRIEVAPLVDDDQRELAVHTAAALGLRHVELAGVTAGALLGPSMAAALGVVLVGLGLEPGDVLLVASGRTVYEAARSDLPQLPGVVIVPTVGGQDEPEAWYQINEITRQLAVQVGGRPRFLYAPALPGPELHTMLLHDTSTRQVLDLWEQARCAILGIGAPPLQRSSIARSIPTEAEELRRAVGDVCLRFFDADGDPVEFPGSERLIATPLEVLRQVPVTIGLAVGSDKIPGIVAAARAGFINELVTDVPTASAVLQSLERTE